MVTNLADTLPPIAPSSLLLITSTLGAPATWLLNAYVAETLRPHAQNSKGRGVVLVSFVNDNCFFREGLRRGVRTCPCTEYYFNGGMTDMYVY